MFVQVVLFIILTGAIQVSSLDCNQNQNKNQATSALHRLREKLMCNYDKDLIPVANTSEALHISLSFDLLNFYIREKHVSEMYTTNELVLSWMDIYLKWKPEDYESINEIEMSTDDIWSPNLIPVETEFITGESSILESADCKVTSTGNVTCIVPSSHYGFCENDPSEWPHGIFRCTIKYDSLTYHGQILEFNLVNDGMVNIMPDANKHWKVLNQTSMQWQASVLPHMRVHEMFYIFGLQSIGTEHNYALVIPAIVLSVMMLSSYWVSTRKNARLMLIALNLVGHIFQMQHAKWNISSSYFDAPFILIFYRNSFILVAIGLFETMILKKILQSDNATPRWMVIIDKITDQRVIRHLLLLDLLEIRESADEEDGSIVKEIKLFDRNNQMEKNQIAQIIDRLLFVVTFLVYLVLIIILLMH